MKDRSVEFPNRYRMVKVEGTNDIFDLVPAPGEISEEGTFINKATLLKDATAGLFGLGADAVPDDVFGVLSRFQNGLGNEYVWEKTKKTVQTEIGTTGLMYLCASNKGSSTVQYADACEVSADGSVALKNPISVSVSTLVSYGADFLRGKYFLNPTHPGDTDWVKGIVYIHPTDGEIFGSSYSSLCIRGGSLYTPYVTIAVFGYVNSPDPNSYPVDDGYTYTALGQLGAKVRIATGSYTGTGTYGASNPNSITFDFEPVFLVIYYGSQKTVFIRGCGTALTILDGPFSASTLRGWVNAVTFSGNELAWYNGDHADYQLNTSGAVYNYIAIG